MRSIFVVICIIIGILFSNSSYSSGLLGQAFKDLGNATKIGEFNKLGGELDNEHRKLKKGVPLYGKSEEELSNIFRKHGTKACSLVFNAVMDPMIARCSNWQNRLEDKGKIADAITLLVSGGFDTRASYDKVTIRFCPLTPGSEGIAPHRNKLYLDSSNKNVRLSELAALIAHEMKHIEQYRKLGSERFKCKYAQEYLRCGFCQNESHQLENEAYQYQSDVLDLLQRKHQSYTEKGMTNLCLVENQNGTCVSGFYGNPGRMCNCDHDTQYRGEYIMW